MLLITLAIGSMTVLVFSTNKIVPTEKKINCCKQVNQKELFVPWNIISQSLLFTKA